MNAADIIYESDSLYFVDIPRIRIETLKAIARRLHYNESVNCIIIDDVDAITTEQYQIITEELKDLAMELAIPIVIMFQGSWKEPKQETQAGFADCSRCTAERITRVADTVIFLERKMSVGFERAHEIYDIIAACGLLGEEDDINPGRRKIVIGLADYDALYARLVTR